LSRASDGAKRAHRILFSCRNGTRGTPVHFRDFIASDIVTWRKVVNEVGIAAEAGR